MRENRKGKERNPGVTLKTKGHLGSENPFEGQESPYL